MKALVFDGAWVALNVGAQQTTFKFFLYYIDFTRGSNLWEEHEKFFNKYEYIQQIGKLNKQNLDDTAIWVYYTCFLVRLKVDTGKTFVLSSDAPYHVLVLQYSTWVM